MMYVFTGGVVYTINKPYGNVFSLEEIEEVCNEVPSTFTVYKFYYCPH